MNIEDKISLSRIRLEKANTALKSARLMLENGDYLGANNRIYYAMLYAIKALVIFKDFDSKKHIRIIGFFNKEYVKNGFFNIKYGKLTNKVKRLRESSDYDDFYIVDKEDTNNIYFEVEEFVKEVSSFISSYKLESE